MNFSAVALSEHQSKVTPFIGKLFMPQYSLSFYGTESSERTDITGGVSGFKTLSRMEQKRRDVGAKTNFLS